MLGKRGAIMKIRLSDHALTRFRHRAGYTWDNHSLVKLFNKKAPTAYIKKSNRKGIAEFYVYSKYHSLLMPVVVHPNSDGTLLAITLYPKPWMKLGDYELRDVVWMENKYTENNA
jgi:uncharacterized protein (DUF1800 family)